MFKNLLRIISLTLACIMMLCVLGGCNNSSTTSTPNDDAGTSDEKIEFLVNPEDYRGTTVTYVTWKDPDKNEDGPVIDAFEKKYGITVNAQLVSEGNYVQAIAASIASGTQGDIFFENGSFPGSLTVMQPLDAAKINFDDPIWRKDIIAASTLDGHPYLVDTVSNVWNETDIVVYNKKIFEENNLNTPEDYYLAGKWTFEAFKECAKQVSELGTKYIGAQIISSPAVAAAGSSFFTYKDNKMTVTVDDHLYDVMTFLSQMAADGQLSLGRTNFNDGNVGMAITNCFALKKTGYFTNINPEHLGFTYLPVWKEGTESFKTSIYRGWGLIKGAKNPVAAGIFLREYLDVNNYDLDLTFHSEEAANFFFKVNAQQSDNTIYYHDSDMKITTGLGDMFVDKWVAESPSQIRGYIEKNLNVMESMCKAANDIIETERKWLAENY